jgi:hypothetical protein
VLIAFPRQQWLHERASLLRYMYIAGLGEVFFQFHQLYTDLFPTDTVPYTNALLENLIVTQLKNFPSFMELDG